MKIRYGSVHLQCTVMNRSGLCELVIQSFDKKIKAHKESELPVLHVHQEDEDGSMYPLAEGTQRMDENGHEIFTFPGQDDKGHRKAQTEYCLVRFGNEVIIETNSRDPHKQWIPQTNQTPFKLFQYSKPCMAA